MKSLKIILFIFLCTLSRTNLFPYYFGLGPNIQFMKLKITIDDPIIHWNQRLIAWTANIPGNSLVVDDSEASSFFIRNKRFNLFDKTNVLPQLSFLFGYENFFNKKCLGAEILFELYLSELKKNEVQNIKNDTGKFFANITATGGNTRRVEFENLNPIISNASLIIKNPFSFTVFFKIGFMLFEKTILYTKIGVSLKKIGIDDFNVVYENNIFIRKIAQGNDVTSLASPDESQKKSYSFLENLPEIPDVQKSFYTFSFPLSFGIDQFLTKKLFIRFEYKIQIFNEKRLSEYGTEKKVTEQLMTNDLTICFGIKI